jgi:hypothetical protein
VIPVKYDDMLDRGGWDNVFCPEPDVVRLLDCPVDFYNWMEENGFRRIVPAPWLPRHGFPCILKENRSTSSGEGVHVIRTQRELDEVSVGMSSWCLRRPIAGFDEWAVHLVVNHGVVLRDIWYHIRLPSPLHIKSGVMPVNRRHHGLSGLDRVFSKLNYHGFATVNLKMVDGNPVIFEINPRIGGSLATHPADLKEMLALVPTFTIP